MLCSLREGEQSFAQIRFRFSEPLIVGMHFRGWFWDVLALNRVRWYLFLLDGKVYSIPRYKFAKCSFASHWYRSNRIQTFGISRTRVEFCKKTFRRDMGSRRIHNRSGSLREIYLSRPRSRKRHCYGFGFRSRSGFVLFYINLQLHPVACDALAL